MRWAVLSLLEAALLAATLSATEPSPKPALRPRRLYFGAPPAASHELGPDMKDCLACHGEPGMGAPLTPHPTRLRCQQCHVSAAEEVAPFRATKVVGLPSLGRAPRVQPAGPPVVPHPVLLRENCLACHAPGAREDVLSTPHPERLRCQQCHVPQRAVIPFRPRP